MTYDLRAGLAALGHEGRDVAPSLPVDALTARAHRSRTLHAATYSAIGVGAAAVLTLGAISADGLLLDHDPAPPATDEPRPTLERTTASPTPSPTPTPSATPTEAAWQPSWELCGMPVEDLYDRETAWDWDAETGWWLDSAWPADTLVPVDEPVPLTLSVNGTGAAGAIVEAQVTDVVAVETDYQAGTSQVVGVAAEPTGDVVRGRGVAEIGVSLGTFETRLVSCDASPLTGGDGALDTGLPGEGYDVVVVAEVRVDEGDTMTTVTYAGHLGALPDPPELPESEVPDPNGEPNGGWQYRTLTVGTPLRLGPEETVHLSCGTPASTEPLRYDAAPEVTLTGTGFRDGAELIAQMTLTNTGDTPLREVNLEYPDVTVSSNGSVVGSAYGHLVDFKLPRLLQPGESVQLEMSLGQSTCALAGSEPWPAGTYELQAGASLLVTRDVAESGIAGYEVRTTFTLD